MSTVIPDQTPELTGLLYGLTWGLGATVAIEQAFVHFVFNDIATVDYMTNLFTQGALTDPTFQGKDRIVLKITEGDATERLIDVFVHFGQDYHVVIKEGVAVAYSETGGLPGGAEAINLTFYTGTEDFTAQQLVFMEFIALEPGVNSVTTEQDLVAHAMRRMDIPAVMNTLQTDIKMFRTAMMNAYTNIAELSLSLVFDGQHLVNITEVTPELLQTMPVLMRQKLIFAQLIEANFLLGGDPIEERRRAGLMSHSAGESAHFMRPTKPIRIPVSVRTAEALSGLISWQRRILR